MMIANTVEIEGTLQADGQLILDEKPALPPGRVRVTLQAINNEAESTADFVAVLHRIRADQQARRHVSRMREEIDSAVDAMRGEDEVRMQAIERLHEECRLHRPEKPARSSTSIRTSSSMPLRIRPFGAPEQWPV
jgi:hypothetical protein